MNKYIIKNCPAITKSTVCVDDKYSNLCKDITDCVMKQIVDECNNAKQRAKDYSTNAYSGGVYDETNRILELLEIEECE